jgi:hypothetical protein
MHEPYLLYPDGAVTRFPTREEAAGHARDTADIRELARLLQQTDHDAIAVELAQLLRETSAS